MHCRIETDLIGFADRVMPWLEREPVGNNVLSTVVDSRVNGGVAIEPDGVWAEVIDGHELVGVATVTPPRGALLSAMSVGAARVLADQLASTRPSLPSGNGPLEAVTAFRDTFTARTGTVSTAGMASRIFHLDTVNRPTGVPGSHRAATEADRDLLVAWSAAFAAEATPDHPLSDPAAPVDARLPDGDRMWLWETDGERVAMVWLSQCIAGVTRVSGVYTPPERRGHGYASACVAATSQYALDTGATACVLYTDLANPISNRIYQRLGYRPLGDSQEWFFTRPS